MQKVSSSTIVHAALHGRKSAMKYVNKERAERAKKALLAWIPPDTDGFSEDKLETDILGLLIDLLHFAEQSKIEVRPLLHLAVLNLELETGK